MPFEELKKELTGKYLVIARGISDPDLSAVYLFDAKDEERVKKILAEERAYVEKKKKNHSLPRLFKKNGVSFDSVSVHSDTMVIWNKPEEEEEKEDEKPKRGVPVGGVGPKYHKKQKATSSSDESYIIWDEKPVRLNEALRLALGEEYNMGVKGVKYPMRRGRKRRMA